MNSPVPRNKGHIDQETLGSLLTFSSYQINDIQVSRSLAPPRQQHGLSLVDIPRYTTGSIFHFHFKYISLIGRLRSCALW